MSRRPLCTLALLALSLAACGDDAPGDPIDGGSVDAAPARCETATDCDDGLFCNGTERCTPGDPAANAEGCTAGTAPCAGRCDDAADRCLTGCDVPDADQDGRDAEACGGDDCDDGDADRFPGNVELCDALGRDEDCDPTTLGHDLDRDSHVDDRCCNLQTDGALRCGDDCDDLSDSVGPGASDVCNARDDDCDTRTDEEPTLVFYRDADGDGWGVAGDPDDLSLPEAVRPLRACALPDGYSVQPGDCDDEDVRAAPGSLELCGGGDEDCDTRVDEWGPGVRTPAIDARLWYRDDDGDGWGNTDRVALGCVAPADGFHYSARLGDCRDDRVDVNPGITRAVSRPSCPPSYQNNDTLTPLRALRCGAVWECVQDDPTQGPDQLCGRYTFLDAVWDVDCSGAIDTFPVTPVYVAGPDACVFFAQERPRPEQCGLGFDQPESYGTPVPPMCAPVPIGELGPIRCR